MTDGDTSLRRLGWGGELAAALAAACPQGRPGRVARVDRGGWLTLASGCGERRARLHPRFRRVGDPLDRPTVGDWVVIPPQPADEPVIEELLPRRSVIVRNTGGDEHDVGQALAANVDTAFLALPLDGDRNPRRTDRFVALVRAGGADPVLLLTKADRTDAAHAAAALLEARRHGTSVHAVSAHTGAGLGALRAYLGPGRTVVLLGVSGAGKSTLINHLLGRGALPTGAVRRDGSGRHTTTHRSLLPLPGGGVLIDTPGLRSVALWDEDVAAAFADVEAAAAGCRFTDCTHEREPGCGVRAALASVHLAADRWHSYQRLRAEQTALAARRRDRRWGRRSGR
jgi:ribosome biogenesis GTPase / thiamine phosphate phosphatase